MPDPTCHSMWCVASSTRVYTLNADRCQKVRVTTMFYVLPLVHVSECVCVCVSASVRTCVCVN